MNCENNNTHNIPAGFPYNFTVKLSKAEAGSTTYEDITNPASIPSSDWRLCFVDANNNAALALPLDWEQMDGSGLLLLSLTAGQTLELAGKRLRLEVRNNAGTSDLLDAPEDVFVFVPNNLHN